MRHPVLHHISTQHGKTFGVRKRNHRTENLVAPEQQQVVHTRGRIAIVTTG